MEDRRYELAVGVNSFEEIMAQKSPYVDKTSYLAAMIASERPVWFFTRPHGFGKSLTVSTLEAVFTKEKRELFQGLAIYSRLAEEKFHPRPVIRLDMSRPSSAKGAKELWASLGREIARKANELGLAVDPKLSPEAMISSLIIKLAENSGRKVAILIDEYDSPFKALGDQPKEKALLTKAMGDFYAIFNKLDKYISFIFVTGMVKEYLSDIVPIFNPDLSPDISIDPGYGALGGFTPEEVTKYFGQGLQRVAATLKMTEPELVAKLEDYYWGFCFDGETRVFSPWDILLFFERSDFFPYWFYAGWEEVLADILKERRLTVWEFRDLTVTPKFARNPGVFAATDPLSLFYQVGYLSLRPGPMAGVYRLDYPNQAVLRSLAEDWVYNIPGRSSAKARFKKLRAALDSGNAALVMRIFNQFLDNLSADDYPAALAKQNDPPLDMERDRWFYWSALLTLIVAAGLEVGAGDKASSGARIIAVKRGDLIWVIELLVRPIGPNELNASPQNRAEVRAKPYPAQPKNPSNDGL
ncbi:MAG: AAA family ATPase [Deltaproteobacteria bacterium]|jgi:hypothetical protein|nr:AAA family ATPase [Deltaproteobacteria bacterium]